MEPISYIACDLGAESGRVMIGTLSGGRLRLEEIHRFPSASVRVLGSLRWDVLRIFEELKAGLRKAGERGTVFSSLSVDSWGVDYVLFNKAHPVLSAPFHYRDSRTDHTYDTVRAHAGEELIFEETGIQFMSINTLYQLAADTRDSRAVLEAADAFLNIGDYFNYLFSGVARNDETNASTTQLFNPRTREWSEKLIARCELPGRIFPPLVRPGTVLGPLLAEVAEQTKLSEVKVVATCSHDTGAAVAAVPAQENDEWAFLSSGTWSLIGAELPHPLINEEVRRANFTNEAGFGGTTRFLKNIIGLWILQECRRAWAAEGREIDYAKLTAEAAAAEPLRSLVNPNDARFWKPGDMPRKVASFCEETHQPVPETQGEYARAILESLALSYRQNIQTLESLTGRAIRKLHVVGGGSQSVLLNQFTANATGRETVAGPVEATAIGNVLVQAIALGHLGSLAALRAVVRESFPLQSFLPADPARWNAAFERFSSFPHHP